MKSWRPSRIRIPRGLFYLAALMLAASSPKSPACLRPDGSNQADYINYATNGPCNQYVLYLVAQYSGGTAYGDLTYKDRWNGLIPSHEVQNLGVLSPTNYFIAIGTNWYTSIKLCEVADFKV